MSPLDNLGDYNIVRDDLHRFGGDAAKLYKNIGDTAIAEKAPALLAKGGLIGAGVTIVVGLGLYAVVEGAKFLKQRKMLIENKPQLEQQLAKDLGSGAGEPASPSTEAVDNE